MAAVVSVDEMMLIVGRVEVVKGNRARRALQVLKQRVSSAISFLRLPNGEFWARVHCGGIQKVVIRARVMNLLTFPVSAGGRRGRLPDEQLGQSNVVYVHIDGVPDVAGTRVSDRIVEFEMFK